MPLQQPYSQIISYPERVRTIVFGEGGAFNPKQLRTIYNYYVGLDQPSELPAEPAPPSSVAYSDLGLAHLTSLVWEPSVQLQTSGFRPH